jgi:hypothetical protein
MAAAIPVLIPASMLRAPIRNYVHYHVGLVGIIREEMDCKIVRPIHSFVHREGSRFYDRTFTGLENHRTDG